ncbi:MAG: hypothetical protein M1831_005103 [Alyxoria varia]|nr:MAG: hypothetical protein M1831_005103 [Alyxoria varia]
MTSLPVVGKNDRTDSKLAAHDDILTDALVDRVYFWDTILKNDQRYHASRYIKQDDITKIVRGDITFGKNPGDACSKLFALRGIKQYMDKLDDREQDNFRCHLRKYVKMYLPEAPFEVTTTNRYKISSLDAAVSARRLIRKNETIRHLTGILLPLTPQAEKELALNRRDFSVIISSRKRIPSLFLGPARFANHDCENNAKLIPEGSKSMIIVAKKDIDIGEEITVSYGDDYFGENNCECLCRTCDKKGRNGWNGGKPDFDNPSSEVGAPSTPADYSHPASDPRSLFSKNKSVCTPSSSSQEQRRKFSEMDDQEQPDPNQKVAHSSFNVAPSLDSVSSKLREDASGKGKKPSPTTLPHSSAFSSLNSSESNPSLHSTPATSISAGRNSQPLSQKRHGEKALSALSSNTDSPQPRRRTSLEHVKIEESSSREQSILEAATQDPRLDSQHQLTSGQTDAAAAAAAQKTMENRITEGKAPNITNRKPGDYMGTRAILCSLSDRWTDCGHCNQPYVQREAHQTRWMCHRCERHLKLYGFAWPKTERGKNDESKRILDTREICVFVYPEDEKTIKKGKRARDAFISEMVHNPPEIVVEESETGAPQKTRSGRTSGVKRTHEEFLECFDEEDELSAKKRKLLDKASVNNVAPDMGGKLRTPTKNNKRTTGKLSPPKAPASRTATEETTESQKPAKKVVESKPAPKPPQRRGWKGWVLLSDLPLEDRPQPPVFDDNPGAPRKTRGQYAPPATKPAPGGAKYITTTRKRRFSVSKTLRSLLEKEAADDEELENDPEKIRKVLQKIKRVQYHFNQDPDSGDGSDSARKSRREDDVDRDGVDTQCNAEAGVLEKVKKRKWSALKK